jgi:hypothetical protein
MSHAIQDQHSKVQANCGQRQLAVMAGACSPADGWSRLTVLQQQLQTPTTAKLSTQHIKTPTACTRLLLSHRWHVAAQLLAVVMAGISQGHVKADVLRCQLLVLIHHVLAGTIRDEALSQVVLQAVNSNNIGS